MQFVHVPSPYAATGHHQLDRPEHRSQSPITAAPRTLPPTHRHPHTVTHAAVLVVGPPISTFLGPFQTAPSSATQPLSTAKPTSQRPIHRTPLARFTPPPPA